MWAPGRNGIGSNSQNVGSTLPNGSSYTVVDGLRGKMVDFSGEIVFVPDEEGEGDENAEADENAEVDEATPMCGVEVAGPAERNDRTNDPRSTNSAPMTRVRSVSANEPNHAISRGAMASISGLPLALRTELLNAPDIRQAVEQVRAVLGDACTLNQIQDAVLFEGGDVQRALGKLLDEGQGPNPTQIGSLGHSEGAVVSRGSSSSETPQLPSAPLNQSGGLHNSHPFGSRALRNTPKRRKVDVRATRKQFPPENESSSDEGSNYAESGDTEPSNTTQKTPEVTEGETSDANIALDQQSRSIPRPRATKLPRGRSKPAPRPRAGTSSSANMEGRTKSLNVNLKRWARLDGSTISRPAKRSRTGTDSDESSKCEEDDNYLMSSETEALKSTSLPVAQSSSITPTQHRGGPIGKFDPNDYTPSPKPISPPKAPNRPPVGRGGLIHLFTTSIRVAKSSPGSFREGVIGIQPTRDVGLQGRKGVDLNGVTWVTGTYGHGTMWCGGERSDEGIRAAVPYKQAGWWGQVARLVKANVLEIRPVLYQSKSLGKAAKSKATATSAFSDPDLRKRRGQSRDEDNDSDTGENDDAGPADPMAAVDNISRFPYELRLNVFITDAGARYGEGNGEDGYVTSGDGKKMGKGLDSIWLTLISDLASNQTPADPFGADLMRRSFGSSVVTSYVTPAFDLADAYYRANFPEMGTARKDISLDSLLSLLRPPLNAPEACQPPGLGVTMYPFQRRALRWMMDQEINLLPDGDTLHPLWVPFRVTESKLGDLKQGGKLAAMLTERRGKVKSAILYQNESTGTLSFWRFATPPSEPGGCLAEEMGLGKTVEVVALILAHPRGAFDASRSAVMIAAKEERDRPARVKATLIVAPQAIVGQWSDELTRLAPGLVVKEYLGRKGRGFESVPGKTDQDAALTLFGKADVVLTTYETLQSDLSKTSMSVKSPLLWVEWWRVCVDEAQLVANTNGAAAQMASELWRVNGWTVTGTPISNSLIDIHGLAVFLDHDPFADRSILDRSVIAPWLKGNSESKHLRLPAYLRKFMWRHSKQDVAHEMSLPLMTHLQLRMTFSKTEALWYQRLLADAKTYLKTLFHARGSLALDTQVMSKVLELRQACNHPQIASRFAENNKERLTERQILQRVQEDTAAELADLEMDWVLEALTLSFGLIQEKSKLGKRPLGVPITNLDEIVTALLKPALNVINVNLLRLLEGDERIRRLFEYFEEIRLPLVRWLRCKYSALTILEELSELDEDLLAEKAAFPDLTLELNPRDVEQRYFDMKYVKVGNIQAENHEGLRNKAIHEEIKTPRRQLGTIWDALKRKESEIKVKEAELRHVNNQIEEKRAREHTSTGYGASVIGEVQNVASLAPPIDLKGKGKAVDTVSDNLPSFHKSEPVRQADADECIICNDSFTDPIMVPCCLAKFDAACLKRWLSTGGNCPMCRAQVSTKDFLEVAEEESAIDAQVNLLSGANQMEIDMSALYRESVEGEYGTKISGLVVDVRERVLKDPTFKAVIFTSWKSMHNWVFEALTRNGVVSVNFNTPSLERRRQALDAIKTDPKVRVILVSLKSREGAAGLTLTCCTAVYLLEPIMNPGLEAQAIGRVNRIGQTRETTVIRLVMSGTIEETILKYAESKKMNASNQIPQGDGAAGSSFESSKAQPFDFFLGEKEEFQTGQVLEMFGLTMEELKMARRREGGRNEGDEESDGDNESDEEDESDPESERAQESESDSDA